ncbi:MAG: hypothetical protein LUE27_03605 [Clostridia bacterium]|nr:hypothetical protein [Clostridia bacterium]
MLDFIECNDPEDISKVIEKSRSTDKPVMVLKGGKPYVFIMSAPAFGKLMMQIANSVFHDLMLQNDN